jgi:hypothetical protein
MMNDSMTNKLAQNLGLALISGDARGRGAWRARFAGAFGRHPPLVQASEKAAVPAAG